VVRAETQRQVAAMSAEVARTLSLLPALGDNGAGPLARGRLSTGHVGQAIRAIQAALGELLEVDATR
jgi:hypothetical protein